MSLRFTTFLCFGVGIPRLIAVNHEDFDDVKKN